MKGQKESQFFFSQTVGLQENRRILLNSLQCYAVEHRCAHLLMPCITNTDAYCMQIVLRLLSFIISKLK